MEEQEQQPESDEVENDPRGEGIEGGSASVGSPPPAQEDVNEQAENPEPDPAGEGQS